MAIDSRNSVIEETMNHNSVPVAIVMAWNFSGAPGCALPAEPATATFFNRKDWENDLQARR